jgi:hypothetical protein
MNEEALIVRDQDDEALNVSLRFDVRTCNFFVTKTQYQSHNLEIR